MITTGSTRGKCSAEQLGQRRDQPPRSTCVGWPQLAQKPCRLCHHERLSAAANSGASSAARIASSGKADQALSLASSIEQKQGVSPLSPRNSPACPSGPQLSRPSAVR